MVKLYTSDFCLLRTPLLPLNKTFQFFKHLDRDSDKILPILTEIYSDPLLKEALYVSSPELFSETEKYLSGCVLTSKDKSKIENSLIKYYIRMSSRCTPFGLCAGFSIGFFSDKTKITFKEGNNLERYIKYDMYFICKIVALLIKDNKIRKKLYFRHNNSIYKVGKKLRFMQYSYVGIKRVYSLIELESSILLTKIISQTKKDTIYNDLIVLITDFGYPEAEAISFINELIDNQVLISEIDPNVTGEDYFDRLSKIFEQRELKSDLIETLHWGHMELQKINNLPNKVTVYKEVVMGLKKILPDFDEGKCFQVDLRKLTTEVSINSLLKAKILKAVHVLKKFSNYEISETRFEYFKRAFFEKYEYSTVKLTEALDDEIGLDYTNALSTEDHYKTGTSLLNNLNSITKLKISKYIDCIKRNSRIVILKDDDFKHITDNKIQLPDSFSVVVNLFHNDQEKDVYIRSVGGPSGANLIGRFCYTDTRLKDLVLDLIKKEECLQSNKIFAEIAHLPQSRIGNIIGRPRLRKYEIPYLTNTYVEEENIISIEDLYLKREGDKIVLISKRLGKEVIPRLSTAHNYTYRALSIYRFLAEIQSQNVQMACYWTWGPLENETFLPRVTYEGVIISLSSWNLTKNLFNLVTNKTDNQTTLKERFQSKKKEFSICRYVTLLESDTELLLDMENAYCIDFLLACILKRDIVRIQEYLFYENNSVVENGNQFYANEFILPFIKNNFNVDSISRPDKPIGLLEKKSKTEFHIGSEWIYFKLYCNQSSMDRVLSHIGRLTRKLNKQEKITGWFFVRYRDPKPHIRLRFKVSDTRDLALVIAIVFNNLKSYTLQGVVSDIKIDKYKQEIERYGANTIGISEKIFEINSTLTCQLLKLVSQDRKLRFLAGIYIINSTFNALAYSELTKIEFCKSAFTMYSFEFNLAADKELSTFLKNDYRENEEALENILNKSTNNNDILKTIQTVVDRAFKEKSIFLKELFEKCRVNEALRFEDVLISHIHMFYNRLFDKDQRQEEFKMYNYLKKKYISATFKGKQ